jgi:hypothetical protein
VSTNTTTDLKKTRLATAEALRDAGAQLSALTAAAGEYDLDVDMVAIKKMAGYMQLKGAEMLEATQIDLSIGAAQPVVKVDAVRTPVPEQVVGRRAGLPPAADRVDLAEAHFEEVLTLLGAASCRTMQPTLAQDLVLLAHAAALRGLAALSPEKSLSDSDQSR